MTAAENIPAPYTVRRLQPADTAALLEYLNGLGNESKSRFGPHAFSTAAIEALYANGEDFTGYIVTENNSTNIIAYAIVKRGFLQHDRERLEGYGMLLSNTTDCTFAPSVADAWQGRGVGQYLFNFIVDDVRASGCKRIILWGGVQNTNSKAIRYYRKNGFTVLGSFEYNGYNTDMACIIA